MNINAGFRRSGLDGHFAENVFLKDSHQLDRALSEDELRDLLSFLRSL